MGKNQKLPKAGNLKKIYEETVFSEKTIHLLIRNLYRNGKAENMPMVAAVFLILFLYSPIIFAPGLPKEFQYSSELLSSAVGCFNTAIFLLILPVFFCAGCLFLVSICPTRAFTKTSCLFKNRNQTMFWFSYGDLFLFHGPFQP